MWPPERLRHRSDIMLTTQLSTYGLISCNNPSKQAVPPAVSYPGLPPSYAPIMQPRHRRPHHPLADRP
eukprot:6857296-Prymnesium_polylepis.1